MPIKDELRDFVARTFLFDDSEMPGDDDSFMDRGIIDSTGVLHLVMFLQSRFEIEVADEELVPENFDSINSIASFVTRKLELA